MGDGAAPPARRARRLRLPRRARRRRGHGVRLRLHRRPRTVVDGQRGERVGARAARGVARPAALRDRRAARATRTPAERHRLTAPGAIADAPAARPRDSLHPVRLAKGAPLLREERLDGAGRRRLRARLPAVPGPRKAAVAAGYLPAFFATKSATAWICASLSWPLKAGIAPPPTATWCATASFDGFSWSRFGPTLPVEPAAFSVWQPPQPADAKTAVPSGFAAGVGAVFPFVVAGR